MTRFRSSTATPRLEREAAVRQGHIARLAFQVLGKDRAIAFLNTEHAALGGRPLDLATLSDEGRNSVEAELGRMAYATPVSSRD
ncbi:MbcA/ParS/Xre antitoxin family protein [Croceibacterium selenioxidans]|uniref:MbcA/ParS/Xre antitoxin family protein n=1 Tax=Croceibacterium selenioxidans TaxID=2838833 RepID=UPI00308455BA